MHWTVHSWLMLLQRHSWVSGRNIVECRYPSYMYSSLADGMPSQVGMGFNFPSTLHKNFSCLWFNIWSTIMSSLKAQIPTTLIQSQHGRVSVPSSHVTKSGLQEDDTLMPNEPDLLVEVVVCKIQSHPAKTKCKTCDIVRESNHFSPTDLDQCCRQCVATCIPKDIRYDKIELIAVPGSQPPDSRVQAYIKTCGWTLQPKLPNIAR